MIGELLVVRLHGVLTAAEQHLVALNAMSTLSYERQAALQHCVVRFQERFDELAMALCAEAAKPLTDSRGEVTRLIDAFLVAAEEADMRPQLEPS